MKGWKEFSLIDLISIKHGFAFKGENFSVEPTENVLVTPGNFAIGGGFKHDKYKYYCGEIPQDYVLKENDIIITMTDLSKDADTLGYSAKVPKQFDKKFLHNQRIGLVIPKNDLVNMEYIYWVMRTFEYQKAIAGSASGATVKHTSPSKICLYKFKAPVKPETQQKIAAILSAYDDLIETNLRRIALLEETARITYEEWFVRFRPNGEPLPLDPQTGLPEGWKKTMCYEVMDVMSGGTPKTSDENFWNGKIPFFTPKDATQFTYTTITEKTLTDQGLKNCNSKLYPKNTIFVTARGTVGKINMASTSMAMNQSCYALKGKHGLSPYFLFHSLKASMERFKTMANGGVFDTIVVDTFRHIPFVLPSEKIVSDFVSFVQPFHESILTLLTQNRHLKEARDLLLPRLMSGQIEIEEAS